MADTNNKNAAAVEAVEAKAVEAKAEAKPVTATFPISGTIRLRGDGQAQSAFNLLINANDAEALDALKRLAEHVNAMPANAEKTQIEVVNDRGEAYVTVKLDKRSLSVIKRQRTFETNVEGVVRIVGAVNGQFRGEMDVKTATPADILTGGRVVDRVNDNGYDNVSAPTTGRTGLRGFRS